jgi:hypothetical protein
MLNEEDKKEIRAIARNEIRKVMKDALTDFRNSFSENTLNS